MKSLYWRMVLAISATLMLLAIAYILVSVRASKNYFMETTQKLNAKVAEYREIVNTVQRFKDGDLEARVPPINTQSEIKGLADTFNQMADNMVSNIEKLKNVDLLRRELIANVSHDRRNPIAIVNGYIETLIIRGDQVTPEEQKKYLAIINESVDNGHVLPAQHVAVLILVA